MSVISPLKEFGGGYTQVRNFDLTSATSPMRNTRPYRARNTSNNTEFVPGTHTTGTYTTDTYTTFTPPGTYTTTSKAFTPAESNRQTSETNRPVEDWLDGESDMVDDFIELEGDLLEWSRRLDFDAYVDQWGSTACTYASDAFVPEPINQQEEDITCIDMRSLLRI